MIDRILIAYTRIRAAWTERQSEREFSKAMKKRNAEHGHGAGLGAAILFVCVPLLGGCVAPPPALVAVLFVMTLAIGVFVVRTDVHRRDAFVRLGFASVALTLIALLGGCGGPSPATRTALDEVRTLDAQCSSEIDALQFDADDDDSAIQAALAGCRDRASAFCAAHHLTHEITELCP